MENPVIESTVESAVDATDDTAGEPVVEQELLIEEISIDGMCGVY